ncbi:DUF2057 domain-containing protein [Pseudoalteromonas rhizosphaerae]|uniref:DUF2845 domain-containing protein n=1 Tax=Pseudoalteromonas rhizosphaerae TaxID=2518973 RepID=A0ABW8KUF7_9GAMM
MSNRVYGLKSIIFILIEKSELLIESQQTLGYGLYINNNKLNERCISSYRGIDKMEWYWWGVFIVVGFFVLGHYQNKVRKKRLMEKYRDARIVERLMKKMFWQGQSQEQLLDSLGKPVDIDQKVLKTKTKEIWKYNRTGKGRYGLRITLENGEVIGWDKK